MVLFFTKLTDHFLILFKTWPCHRKHFRFHNVSPVCSTKHDQTTTTHLNINMVFSRISSTCKNPAYTVLCVSALFGSLPFLFQMQAKKINNKSCVWVIASWCRISVIRVSLMKSKCGESDRREPPDGNSLRQCCLVSMTTRLWCEHRREHNVLL